MAQNAGTLTENVVSAVIAEVTIAGTGPASRDPQRSIVHPVIASLLRWGPFRSHHMCNAVSGCRSAVRGQAFTLTELLITISVLAILAGMLLPAIKIVKASADASYCKNNLRQAYLANQGYSIDNENIIAPTEIAIPPLTTKGLPWALFVAPYAEKSGFAGTSNGDRIPTVAVCKVFLNKYPALLNSSLGSTGNVLAWGYVRNPLLLSQNGSATGSTYGANDFSNYCDAAGNQGAPYFRYITWSDITAPSGRIFLCDGYQDSSGQMHPYLVQTGVTPTAANLKYQYTHQWGGSVSGGSGSLAIGSIAQSPDALNRDVHRGKRSYLMCDGSARGMTDSYADSANQVITSVKNPQQVP